jgi:hypothetical protein
MTRYSRGGEDIAHGGKKFRIADEPGYNGFPPRVLTHVWVHVVVIPQGVQDRVRR